MSINISQYRKIVWNEQSVSQVMVNFACGQNVPLLKTDVQKLQGQMQVLQNRVGELENALITLARIHNNLVAALKKESFPNLVALPPVATASLQTTDISLQVSADSINTAATLPAAMPVSTLAAVYTAAATLEPEHIS